MCFFSAYSLYTDAALGTVTVPSVHRDALSQGMAASTTPCGKLNVHGDGGTRKGSGGGEGAVLTITGPLMLSTGQSK